MKHPMKSHETSHGKPPQESPTEPPTALPVALGALGQGSPPTAGAAVELAASHRSSLLMVRGVGFHDLKMDGLFQAKKQSKIRMIY